MKSKLGKELAFITGAGVIIALIAMGFTPPCWPEYDFNPMLVIAGGAGVTMLAPLSGISRTICVLALILALVGAHSEWQTGERFQKKHRQNVTNEMIKRFELERAEWEKKSPATSQESSP